jgi:hypothetical protein
MRYEVTVESSEGTTCLTLDFNCPVSENLLSEVISDELGLIHNGFSFKEIDQVTE